MASKIIKKNRGNTRTKAWLNTQLKKIVPADKKGPHQEELDHEEDEDKSTEDFLSLEEFKEDGEAASEPDEPSVVYIGHLPFGFEEYQLSDFFKQFGEVKRSFVSRSTKTGRSRGYAFVEFHNPTVAQIAADTMHDYLMFRKRLVCRMVPALAAVKIRWPAGAPVEKPLIHTQQIAAMYYNMKNKTEPVDKLIERENKKRERLRKRGIDYEFDGYTELVNKLKQGKTEEKKEEKKQEEIKETPQNGDVDPKKRKRDEEWEQRKQVKIAAEKTDKQKKRDAQLQAKAEKVEKRKEAKAAAQQQKDTTPKKDVVVSAPAKKETTTPKKDIVVTKKDIAAVIPKDTIALKEAADAAAAAKKETTAPKKATPAPKKETATPQKDTPKKAPQVTKANVSAKKKQTSK